MPQALLLSKVHRYRCAPKVVFPPKPYFHKENHLFIAHDQIDLSHPKSNITSDQEKALPHQESQCLVFGSLALTLSES